jgi:hypothetical protein
MICDVHLLFLQAALGMQLRRLPAGLPQQAVEHHVDTSGIITVLGAVQCLPMSYWLLLAGEHSQVL